jgi:hypothetical protein
MTKIKLIERNSLNGKPQEQHFITPLPIKDATEV